MASAQLSHRQLLTSFSAMKNATNQALIPLVGEKRWQENTVAHRTNTATRKMNTEIYVKSPKKKNHGRARARRSTMKETVKVHPTTPTSSTHYLTQQLLLEHSTSQE